MSAAASGGPPRSLLGLPLWTWAVPLAGLALVAAKLAHVDIAWFITAPVLVAAVLSAVHHAEVIAHRIGEP